MVEARVGVYKSCVRMERDVVRGSEIDYILVLDCIVVEITELPLFWLAVFQRRGYSFG